MKDSSYNVSIYKRTSAALFIFIPHFYLVKIKKQEPSMATKCQGFKEDNPTIC